MPPGTVRPLALVAMLGGASFVLAGVAQLASPEQTDPSSPYRSC
jgi:predicted phage tail protein